jgi:hypothetical protein
MSLAKLTSLSTQTLSLLLERQRLQSIPQFQSSSSQPPNSGSTSLNLHLPQITRNLNQLRKGILELESKNVAGNGEAAGLLRNQYRRMRGMLGGDAESLGIQTWVLSLIHFRIHGKLHFVLVGLHPAWIQSLHQYHRTLPHLHPGPHLPGHHLSLLKTWN